MLQTQWGRLHIRRYTWCVREDVNDDWEGRYRVLGVVVSYTLGMSVTRPMLCVTLEGGIQDLTLRAGCGNPEGELIAP